MRTTRRETTLRDGRIEEMDAAGIDIAVLSHTIGGVEGISDPAVAVSKARRVNDFLAIEIAGSGGRAFRPSQVRFQHNPGIGIGGAG